METTEYFVVFKPQGGELEPAYSYIPNETTLQGLAEIVMWQTTVNQPTHTPQEVAHLLEKYKEETGNG